MKYNCLKNIIFFVLIVFVSCGEGEKKAENATTKTVKKDTQSQPVAIVNKPLFTQLSHEETGIYFINRNSETDEFNYYTYEYYYNGGGVAVGDFNNDGFEDIYMTTNMASDRLYLNIGNLKFQDITDHSKINLNLADWSTGVTVVDINNDGWLDIFVSRSGWFKGEKAGLLRNLLFVNNGDLTFTERGIEYGFTDLSPTTQSCFFDADNDGDLDVYQVNHITDWYIKTGVKNGKLLKGKLREGTDFSDRYYENVNGKYIDKTKSSGLNNSTHGLGVIASDFDNDGWQDLYIANDYEEPDYMLMNQKNGKFKNKINSALKHISKFSMGVDVADINNDGHQDIFNAEMLAKDNFSKKTNMAGMDPDNYWLFVNNGYHYQDMHNSLQLNNGNGTFSEIAWMANVAETDWSWCPLFADFNNDGYKDLFVANGYKRDVLSKDFNKKVDKQILAKGEKQLSAIEHLIPSRKISNFIFQNNGDLTFDDKTNDWGLNVGVNTNGAAYADFDNDGDLDLIVNNLNDPAILFRNNQTENNFIKFKLFNNLSIAYGTKVEILDHDNYQVSEVSNARGFQSVSENEIHFGLGKKNKVDSVLITWYNGKKTLLTNPEINKIHVATFKDASSLSLNRNQNMPKQFSEKTDIFNLSYKHREDDYDDYKLEVLLPHKLSQEGPFIDVADINNDGLDDFYVGNGVGYPGELYVQSKSGKFNKSPQNAFALDRMSEDLGVLFFDYDGDGDKDLYVVSGSNEYLVDNPAMQDRIYENDGSGNFTKTEGVLPIMKASGSCVKASDFDNDGDLDLFVGGYLIPNQYPKPGRSYLLLNEAGKFKDVTNEKSDGLQNIGMVKTAQFADINSDGNMDLVVSGHWMPIEIFINDGKTFQRKTEAFGLSNEVGWWNSLLIEDLDNDGYLEIVAGNLGTNTKHKATKEHPFKVYADDFDRSGTNDIVLGYYNEGSLYPVRGKQCSSEQLPSIDDKIKSYTEFGSLNLAQIYGNENLEKSIHYSATNFYTSVFKNINGTSFQMDKLPSQNQFAPVNGIVGIDLNNDSLKDLVMIGNHHPVEVETGRYDAHIGSVLLNDGKSFKNKTSLKSGFFADNDYRDMKSITINNEKYLLLAANRNKLQFFHVK